MSVARPRIEEVDFVSLVETVGGWPAGTTGTVVADFGAEKMVEISDDRGVMLDMPIVPEEKLRLEAKFPLGPED